jgi:hypothetical protein
MTTALSTSNPTIVDIAKERDASGKLLPYIYALSQSNALLRLLSFIETNQARSHQASVETSCPMPSTRILNQGVDAQYGTSAQIEETCAQLKDWVKIDEDVANYGGDPQSYRVRQAQGRLRAMGRKFAYLWFYGNRGANPSDINGLSMRFSAKSGAPNSQNVLSAGGTANTNTSVWLLGLNEYALTGIFPKGSIAGIHHRDWGLRPVNNAINASGNAVGNLAMYEDEFTMDFGLFLADWRHVVRIGDIDVPLLNSQNGADIAFYMDEAQSRLPEDTNLPPEEGVETTKPTYYFFGPRTVQRNLRHQIKSVTVQGAGYAKEGMAGAYHPRWEWEYNGVPYGIVDQILLTESNLLAL